MLNFNINPSQMKTETTTRNCLSPKQNKITQAPDRQRRKIKQKYKHKMKRKAFVMALCMYTMSFVVETLSKNKNSPYSSPNAHGIIWPATTLQRGRSRRRRSSEPTAKGRQ